MWGRLKLGSTCPQWSGCMFFFCMGKKSWYSFVCDKWIQSHNIQITHSYWLNSLESTIQKKKWITHPDFAYQSKTFQNDSIVVENKLVFSNFYIIHKSKYIVEMCFVPAVLLVSCHTNVTFYNFSTFTSSSCMHRHMAHCLIVSIQCDAYQ